jgi:Predicted phosphohydrolases
MRILVLSDLHVGKHARTKDLCPYSEGDSKDKNLVSSFFISIKEEVEKGGEINYIVIPGDMTHEAQELEYKCFSEFVSRMSTELNIGLDKFIFIPGNHDVNWRVFTTVDSTKEQKEIESLKKYDSIKDDRIHLLGSLISADLFNAPYFSIKEFDNAVFVSYNSAWHDEANFRLPTPIIENQCVTISWS